MKNLKFILAVLLLFTASGVFAQLDFRTRVRLGVKAGVNLSNFHVKDNNHFDRESIKMGANVGIFGRIPIINNVFSVQPELMLSQRGVRYSREQTFPGRGSVNLKSTYIDVPVTGIIHIGRSFNIFAGPQLGFLLNARQNTEGSLAGIADGKENVTKRFKSTDFSGVVGIGVEYSSLVLNLRYNMGINKVYNGNANEINTFGHSNARNQWVQLQAGFMF